jgi:hypothetical protein
VTAQPTVLLAAHLKALRLPTFLREYDKIARSARKKGWTVRALCYDSASWNCSIASSAPPSGASRPPSSRS